MIGAISQAISQTPGCVLLDVDAGLSTNRTVYTFVGKPECVVEGALSAARTASRLIDMSRHRGEAVSEHLVEPRAGPSRPGTEVVRGVVWGIGSTGPLGRLYGGPREGPVVLDTLCCWVCELPGPGGWGGAQRGQWTQSLGARRPRRCGHQPP